MKKVFLFVTGMISFAQLVEAQEYICPIGQILCSDQKTCHDPVTECCAPSGKVNRITSVTVEIKNPTSKNEPISLPLQDSQCSQFYYADPGHWVFYPYDKSAVQGGPWTVSLKNEEHSGLCPGSTVVVEAVESNDCFSGGWQLGYSTDLQENMTIILQRTHTEKKDLGHDPQTQPQ